MGALAGGRTFDRTAPRRAVNLSLNEDLVVQARGLTRNLPGTVEALLATCVETERARRRADDARLDEVLDALDALHEEHGLLSDEFPSL